CLPPTPSPHTYTLSLHDALPISPLLIWRPDTETSMTSPATPEARMRSVKIIHGALMAGVSLFLLVTVWLHRVSARAPLPVSGERSEEHTSELQSLRHLVCRLLLE